LIVYGTIGDTATQSMLARAAIAASKSPNPMWVGEQGDGRDGVPNFQLLYGHLKIKPDTAVNAEDLKKYNLVLIGTAAENTLVKKMQAQLPVQFSKEIVCSDGMHLPGTNSMMGLYYYNPLAADRLIYWVAADTVAAYHPYNLLLQLASENPCGLDLLVVWDSPPAIIKVRSFDSRWNWSSAYANTSKIPPGEITFGDVFRRMAEAMRKASGSDFALQQVQVPTELQAGMPGITQWYDIAALDPTTPLAVVRLKGERLLQYQQVMTQQGSNLHFYPQVDQSVKPDHYYQLVLTASFYEIQQLINLQQFVPEYFTILDLTLFEAMKQILF
jgi:hypothetical protein